jgi:hypothetical protein
MALIKPTEKMIILTTVFCLPREMGSLFLWGTLSFQELASVRPAENISILSPVFSLLSPSYTQLPL